MTTYRFTDRDAAEHWADEHGGTVEYRPNGSTIVGVDDERPYVVVPDCPLCGLGNPATMVLEYREFSAVDPRGRLVSQQLVCEPCAKLAHAMDEHDRKVGR